MFAKHETSRKKCLSMIRKWLEIGGELLSSLLFPSRCPICDEILSPEETEKGIHLACENKLYPVEGAVCMHCGRPLGYVNSHKNKKLHEISTDIRLFAEDIDHIPEYMKPESVQEYCRECLHKGYVSASAFEARKKLQECKEDKSNIFQAKALYVYKGVIKKTMYRFKYANKREYARFFAKEAVRKYGTWMGIVSENKVFCPKIDVIVPVPMYLPKQKKRGYNQAECFAMELSKLTGIPVDRTCIRRVKDTTPQKKLKDIERKNNLENAFQKGESIVQYSHILVVDDIYTTGYTAEAVARELRKQGGHHIYLLSICIGGND